jgi:hypothetical protein
MSKEIPDLVIDTDDIHILTDILHPYALYVQQVFSSGHIRMSVVEVNNLRLRFLRLQRFPDQAPIFLTTHEFEVINQAFELFLRAIPQVVPPSAEREATFKACSRMQEAFRRQVLFP